MNITKTLTKEEIEHIIAEFFKTDISNVKLIPYTTTEGYGPMEHQVTKAKCEVTYNTDLY
jgi:hypothetical protein